VDEEKDRGQDLAMRDLNMNKTAWQGLYRSICFEAPNSKINYHNQSALKLPIPESYVAVLCIDRLLGPFDEGQTNYARKSSEPTNETTVLQALVLLTAHPSFVC
jgi:hypothetical protein